MKKTFQKKETFFLLYTTTLLTDSSLENNIHASF